MAPNPVAKQLQLDWGGIPGLRNGHLQIHDMAGRIIWETALRADEHEASVDVGDWPSGMYWVQLTADNLRLEPSKLVVAH